MRDPNSDGPSPYIAPLLWLRERSSGFFRRLAYLFIAVSFYLLASAAYDEFRGVASVSPPTRYPSEIIIPRHGYPEQFRNLMTYQWGRALLALCVGIVILGISRHADRSDPFSDDFAGSPALDDLDRTQKEEVQKRRGPIK